MSPQDEYLTGFSEGTVTIGGHWAPTAQGQLPLGLTLGERRQTVYGDGRRLFGLDWWAERMRFETMVTGWDPLTGEAQLSVVSPVVEERAAWWRRVGYHIVKHLPEGERAA